MYGYFCNFSINRPSIIGQILSDVTPPKGEAEFFIGDGQTNSFNLSIQIPDGSLIRYYINGEETEAIFDKKNNKITFENNVDKEVECCVEYYFPGKFNGDFSLISNNQSVKNDIIIKTKNILSRLLVIAWAESTRDMLVDIQNILRDTDFKLTPNSQILNSKVAWVKELIRENNEEQTKLSWEVRYSKNAGKISRW